MDRFSDLSNDVLIFMALNMDMTEILSLCKSSSRFNLGICRNPTFWIQKLKKDYNINFNEVKSIVSDPKQFYQALKDEPDFLYEEAMKLGLSDDTIGVIVEQMMLKHRKYRDAMLKGEQYYVSYIDTAMFKKFGLEHESNSPVIPILNSIIMMVYADINDGEYEEYGQDKFESIHGKPVEEYLDDIETQLDTIKNKDTVIIKHRRPYRSDEDIYILHKMRIKE